MGIRSLLVNVFGSRALSLLDESNLFFNPVISENQTVIIIGRITTALFIILCLVAILYNLFRRKFQLPLQGILLTVAGLFLYVPVIITSLVNDNSGFSYKLFFFPLFIITAYLLPRFDIRKKIQILLPIFSLFIFSSLLSLLIDPSWAASSYTEGWIGLPIRLCGTSSHPNGLGNIGLTLLILSRFDNKKSFWNYLNIVAAIIVIILAQSKAVWITIAIWALFEWIAKRIHYNRHPITKTLATGLFFIICIATYIFLFQKDLIYSLLGINITLTGRIDVWQITINTWLENPILGYGPNIWDYYFRQGYGFFWAGQAHNQFLQTLGESGIFGIVALFFYCYVVIKLGSKYADVSNFASFGIVIAILTRSLFETPLRNYSLDESFLVHAIFFVILLNSEPFLGKRNIVKIPVESDPTTT